MTDPAPDDDHAPLESLRRAVLAAAEELAGVGAGAGGRTPITLERPRRAEFGDYSTNAALLIAPGAGVPPASSPSVWETRYRRDWEQAWSASRSPVRASSTCSYRTRG